MHRKAQGKNDNNIYTWLPKDANVKHFKCVTHCQATNKFQTVKFFDHELLIRVPCLFLMYIICARIPQYRGNQLKWNCNRVAYFSLLRPCNYVSVVNLLDSQLWSAVPSMISFNNSLFSKQDLILHVNNCLIVRPSYNRVWQNKFLPFEFYQVSP